MKKISDLGVNVFQLATLPFSTSIYNPIMIAFANNINYIDTLSKEKVVNRIESMKNDNEFKKQTKTSSSSTSRDRKKIEVAESYFSSPNVNSNEQIALF